MTDDGPSMEWRGVRARSRLVLLSVSRHSQGLLVHEVLVFWAGCGRRRPSLSATRFPMPLATACACGWYHRRSEGRACEGATSASHDLTVISRWPPMRLPTTVWSPSTGRGKKPPTTPPTRPPPPATSLSPCSTPRRRPGPVWSTRTESACTRTSSSWAASTSAVRNFEGRPRNHGDAPQGTTTAQGYGNWPHYVA